MDVPYRRYSSTHKNETDLIHFTVVIYSFTPFNISNADFTT